MTGRARLVTAIAIAAMLGIPAAWLMRDVRGRDLAFPAGSAQDTSAEGALLAMRYLQERRRGHDGAPVELLRGELQHSDIPANAVLFRLLPEEDSLAAILGRLDEDTDEEDDDEPSSPHDDADDATPPEGVAARRAARPAASLGALSGDAATLRFVREGGRLVLGLKNGAMGVPMVELPEGTTFHRVHPGWAPVDRIAPKTPRGFQSAALPGAHAIFAAGPHAAIARIPFGRGDIVALACPEILLNEALGEADHLALLQALAGDRPAWFDEHAHGAEGESGVMPLLRRAGLGPLLLLGALATACLFWRNAARIGSPEDPHRERRSEAVDFVESVALLYERSLSRAEILLMYRRALEHEVTIREGLRGERLQRRMAALLGNESAFSRAASERDLQHGLARLNDAFRRLDDDRRRSTHQSRA